MNTIQYMGSKKQLLNFIENSIEDFLRENNDKIDTFCDAFSGSGRVSYYFRNKYDIISNDKQYFTKIINDSYLCNKKNISFFQKKIKILNNLKLEDFDHIDFWFTRNYSAPFQGGSSCDKNGNPKIWLKKNALKIDIMRYQIEEWFKENHINKKEKNVLLLTLILGIDKVSNIVGHQNGYLRKWSEKSLNDIVLELPKLDVWTKNNKKHKNYNKDIFQFLKEHKCDLVYFDPPYGTNNKNLFVATKYSSFYHLWNSIIKFDKPTLFGKAGKPLYTKGYTEPLEKNNKEVVMPKFIRLIEESKSKYVSFSYSNKGLLTVHDFKEVFRLAGCDMSTFRLYCTKHKHNSQKETAKKHGTWINRENEKDELIEYFFIAKKKKYVKRKYSYKLKPDEHIRLTKRKSNGNYFETLNAVNFWLDNDGSIENETYKLPNEEYVIML